jgi:DNA-binding response OmpR family regulator
VSVLVVDDDPEINKTLSKVVVRKGLNAVAVRSVEEDLEELEKDYFEVIFLDLALSRMCSVETLSKKRER